VNPRTIQVLDEAGIPRDGLRSKSMTEFLDREFDHVLTVCDDAAEACPVFPGPAVRTHWSIPDPARAVGTDDEVLAVYRATLADLRERIEGFLATLPG
jgi:arsenate reductase